MCIKQKFYDISRFQVQEKKWKYTHTYYPHAEYSAIKNLPYLLLDLLDHPKENLIYKNKIFGLFFTFIIQNGHHNFPKFSNITIHLGEKT